jgi:hypothetical protein
MGSSVPKSPKAPASSTRSNRKARSSICGGFGVVGLAAAGLSIAHLAGFDDFLRDRQRLMIS